MRRTLNHLFVLLFLISSVIQAEEPGGDESGKGSYSSKRYKLVVDETQNTQTDLNRSGASVHVHRGGRSGEQKQVLSRSSVFNANGPTAPPIQLAKMLKSHPVNLDGDTIRLVSFWATWCRPSALAIPALTRAQRYYLNDNVAVIGITSEQDVTRVQQYVENKGTGMAYTVAIDSIGQTTYSFNEIWNVDTIPHVYVVAITGKIVWQGNPNDTRLMMRAIQEAVRLRDYA